MMRSALALVRAWLTIDFFGDSRRTGQDGSSLTSAIFTQSFISLLLAALLFDERAHIVSYVAANLSLSTVLIGIASLAEPQQVDRRIADQTLCATAPIQRSVLPLARAMHGSVFLALLTTGMAIPPAILSYWVAGQDLTIVPLYIVLAIVCAGLVSAAVAVALRATQSLFGDRRAALLAGTMKAVALGGAFAGFALGMPHLEGTAADLPYGDLVIVWPPYLAAKWLSAPATGWTFGAALIAGLVGLFILGVLVGEPRDRRASKVARGTGWLGRLERAIAGGGPLLGTTAFTSAMLFRNPGFRARVLPLFGVPIAMAALAFDNENTQARTLLIGITATFPAIYLPFVVMFLAHGEDRGARWMFDLSPTHDLAVARQAALISLAIRLLLPIQLAGAVLMASLGLAPLAAITLATFTWAMAVFVANLALRAMEHVPFTAPEDDESPLEIGNLMVFAVILALLGGAFAMIAGSAPGVLGAIAVAGVAIALLRREPKPLPRSHLE